MSNSIPHSTEQLFELIAPVCVDSGYELVDIELKQAAQGVILRVYIDFPTEEDKHIGFDDCVALSRQLSAILDVEDPITSQYLLEVSSPGIDRPLRTADHFRNHLGQEAKVVLQKGLEGRRNFKGLLISVSEPAGSESPMITIEVDGEQYDLPLADLSSAKLVPDWNALIKNGKGKKSKGNRA